MKPAKTTIILLTSLILLLTSQTASTQEPTPKPFLQSDLHILTADVQRPNGIYWFNGEIFTGCAGDATIYRINAENGDTITYILGVQNTHMLYVEEGPTVWAADFQLNRIVSINHDTGLSPIKEGLAQPWGLTPSPTTDSFYITQWGTDDIINLTRDGQVHIIASGFEDPTGIIVTEDTIYVANNASARRAVEWLDLSDLTPTPHPLVTGLQKVTNITLGPDGMLYIAYSLGTRGVVGRIDPEICKAQEGGCANSQVELVIWSDLPAPLAGLTVTPEMHLFVHTLFGTEIYWLDLEQNEAS